jgi:hypothetical protein
MRTAPVLELTQAEMLLATGAALAAADAASKRVRMPSVLRETM